MSGPVKMRHVGVRLTPEEYERFRSFRSDEFESLNKLARRFVLEAMERLETPPDPASPDLTT